MSQGFNKQQEEPHQELVIYCLLIVSSMPCATHVAVAAYRSPAEETLPVVYTTPPSFSSKGNLINLSPQMLKQHMRH